MSNQETVRVFIGSGEASLLERKVLIYSLRKFTHRPLDIYVFNGTHNAVELNDEEPFLTSMPLKIKYRNTTEFSFYRFLIPEICKFEGKAIWLDSDMICLSDIGELFDSPMGDCDILAKKTSYSYLSPDQDARCPAVMLLNCATCKFDLEALFAEVDQQLYAEKDMMHLTTKFRERHPYKIGEFDPNWNIRDRYDADTKLIHYTNLMTQPWKYHNHPYGELWFNYLREAMDAGYVTERDIDVSIVRSYVRPDIRKGNFSRMGKPAYSVKSTLRRIKRNLVANK